jgi:RHS repeat-associated protein
VRKVIESAAGVRQHERLYLDGFERYREYSGAGDAIVLERESLHVLDDKRRIALVETLTVQGGLRIADPDPVQRYQLDNHLGSASIELDGAGAVLSYEEYHPHGTTSFQAAQPAAGASRKRYRYRGEERDEETGFGYHGARYYAPHLCRWISNDPAGSKTS